MPKYVVAFNTADVSGVNLLIYVYVAAILPPLTWTSSDFVMCNQHATWTMACRLYKVRIKNLVALSLDGIQHCRCKRCKSINVCLRCSDFTTSPWTLSDFVMCNQHATWTMACRLYKVRIKSETAMFYMSGVTTLHNVCMFLPGTDTERVVSLHSRCKPCTWTRMSAHVITSSRRLQGLIQLMFGEDTSVRCIDEIIRYL